MRNTFPPIEKFNNSNDRMNLKNTIHTKTRSKWAWSSFNPEVSTGIRSCEFRNNWKCLNNAIGYRLSEKLILNCAPGTKLYNQCWLNSMVDSIISMGTASMHIIFHRTKSSSFNSISTKWNVDCCHPTFTPKTYQFRKLVLDKINRIYVNQLGKRYTTTISTLLLFRPAEHRTHPLFCDAFGFFFLSRKK